jgi:hypothetical protein
LEGRLARARQVGADVFALGASGGDPERAAALRGSADQALAGAPAKTSLTASVVIACRFSAH